MIFKREPWEEPYAHATCLCGWAFVGPFWVTADQLSKHHDAHVAEPRTDHNMSMECSNKKRKGGDYAFFRRVQQPQGQAS